jgi:hypothetical protein
MEDLMKKLILTLIVFFLMTSASFAQGLGLGGGLSFWIKNDIAFNDFDIIDKNEKVGFNVNLRTKHYSGFITYTFNVGWSKFFIPDVSLVRHNGRGTDRFTLSQHIIPISSGLQLNLIDLQVINIYLGGEVSFNLIRNRNSLYNSNYSGLHGLAHTIMFGYENQFRVGAAPSAGVEINLGQITLDLNARLHYMNLINKKPGERVTPYLMTNVSFFLNSSKCKAVYKKEG